MPTPRKSIKIKDIAAELGVSNSLVSKVISGNLGTTKVRPDLRDKILKRAKELDFRPNPLSAALKRGRFGAIGLMVHPMGVPGSELFDKLLKGISKSLNRHGLRLWLQFFVDSQEFIDFCNQEIYRSVDGLILAGVPHKETYSLIESLNNDGLPIMTSFRRQSVPGIANVVFDSYLQGKLATAHLIAKGCKRIAFFKVPSDSSIPDERQRGYEDALTEAGIAIDQALISPPLGPLVSFSFIAGRVIVTKLLDDGIHFDGLVAQSDQLAIGAINVLRERGIDVPGQVRVIGMDDSPICTSSTISLSSVTGEMEQVGGELIDRMVDYIEGQKPENQLIAPKVVERESTR